MRGPPIPWARGHVQRGLPRLTTSQPFRERSNQPDHFWRGVVLQALIGDAIFPRGTTPWIPASGLLHAVAVRSTSQHPLHRCNQPAVSYILQRLEERQPFTDQERTEVARRSSSECNADLVEPIKDQAAATEAAEGDGGHAGVPAPSSTSAASEPDRCKDKDAALHRLSASPPSTWCAHAERALRAVRADGGGVGPAPDKERVLWEDILFRVCHHSQIARAPHTGDHALLDGALQAIVHLVEWRIEQIHGDPQGAAVHCRLHEPPYSRSSPGPVVVTPPRWMRKLRKLIMENHPAGAVMVFASFYRAVCALEDSLVSRSKALSSLFGEQPTALTADLELLNFFLSSAARRDSGCDRDSVARDGLKHASQGFVYAWPAALRTPTPAAEFTALVKTSALGLCFAKNDGKEDSRCLELAAIAISNLPKEADAVGRALVSSQAVVSCVLQPLSDALLHKVETLRFTPVAAYVRLRRGIAAVKCHISQSTTNQQPLHVGLASVPDGAVGVDTLLLVLRNVDAEWRMRATPSSVCRVIEDVSSVLELVGGRVTTPKLYDRLASEVLGELNDALQCLGHLPSHDGPDVMKDVGGTSGSHEVHHAPWLAHHVPAVLHAIAAHAPAGSALKGEAHRLLAAPMWRCGCGSDVPLVAPRCFQCGLRTPAVTGAAMAAATCVTCRAPLHSHAGAADDGSCTNCGADHPRRMAAVAAGLWACEHCRTQQNVNVASCGSCGVANPLRSIPCPECAAPCRPHALLCNNCGFVRSRDPEAGPRLRLQVCACCRTINLKAPRTRTHVSDTAADDDTVYEGCATCRGGEAEHVTAATMTRSGEAPVVTGYFRWSCGCGAGNHPSTTACRVCSVPPEVNASPTAKFTCTSCHLVSSVAAAHHGGSDIPLRPHTHRNGVVHHAAVCSGCGALHPRDAQLIAPRVHICSVCDSVRTTAGNDGEAARATQCDCQSQQHGTSFSSMDGGLVVADLPWACHSCGHECSASSKMSPTADDFTLCERCGTERPTKTLRTTILFHPSSLWNCASCGAEACRGMSCRRCSMPHPAIPLADVHCWSCSECHAWHYPWVKSCPCSDSRPHPHLPPRSSNATNAPPTENATLLTWACGRCRRTNAPTAVRCFQCHSYAPRDHGGSARRSTNDDKLNNTRELLLQAAAEASQPARGGQAGGNVSPAAADPDVESDADVAMSAALGAKQLPLDDTSLSMERVGAIMSMRF